MSFQARLIRWWPCLALAASPAFAQSDLAQLSKDPKNWTMQAGDLSNDRYSELKQITSKNAKDLQVAWTFSTGVLRGHEGGPLVIGDTMFLHSPFPNKVFAISLDDQSIRWKYEPKQDATVIPVMCCDTVNRGLAYYNGKIFLQQADTNLVYYGSGNPSTWNPRQRPGDNKWSMTIFARDLDTGVAKWVYQMTPHDEWDYDGVNEMILVDMKVKGKPHKALVHFDRNGFAYTMDRETGELLVAEKYDPAVNWASHVDMKSGRPVVVAKYSTDKNGPD